MQIPDWVIASLGVTSGDMLEFQQQGEHIVLRRKARDILALVAKHARDRGSTAKTEEEFLAQSRVSRGWDEEDLLAFERMEQSR